MLGLWVIFKILLDVSVGFFFIFNNRYVLIVKLKLN